MDRRRARRRVGPTDCERPPGGLLTDGGEEGDSGDESGSEGDEPGLDRSDVEVTEAGEGEPVDPKWEKPDPEDIPEFETGVDDPMTSHRGERGDDPTAGMPNEARSPDDSRIKREGTEGYIVALELCARLPEDIRLPEEAADLVPAAVEAELERDIQSFAAAEFDDPSPHVDVLDFVERDGEVWLRLRIGIPPDAFEELDPEEVRAHALQELEGLL